MQPTVSSLPYPMNLPLIGMQLAGYWIESNLRVAQVLSRAAFEACPGVRYGAEADEEPAAPRVKAQAPAAKLKPVAARKSAARKTVAGPGVKPATVPAMPKAAQAVEATLQPAPLKQATAQPVTTKPAAPAVSKTQVAKPAPAEAKTPQAPQPISEPGHKGAKRPRKPSAPPPIPAAPRKG